MRVALIFFASDGSLYTVSNVLAASNTQADIAAAVRGQWDDNCARCFAFSSTAESDGYDFTAKP